MRCPLTDGWLNLEQLLFQLLVTEIKGTGFVAWTVLAIQPVAVALQILAIEEIGLVTEAAGHPLPAEVVAGGVAIQKVLEEPVSPRTPVHPSPVHQVGRHPHPRVVV